MNCKLCGSILRPDEKFCKNCGTAVDREAAVKEKLKRNRENRYIAMGIIGVIIIVALIGVVTKNFNAEDIIIGTNDYADSEEAAQDENELESQEMREFILPESDKRYLTKDDLSGLTVEECRLARNEIYARHGRIFNDEALQEYFESFDWYYPTIKPEDFSESILNEYEIANRDLIVAYETEQGYR